MTSRQEIIDDIWQLVGGLGEALPGLTVPVLDYVKDERPPYIEFSGVTYTGPFANTKDNRRKLVTFQMTVVTQYKGRKQVTEIGDALVKVLEKGSNDLILLDNSVLDVIEMNGQLINAEIFTFLGRPT